LKPGDPRYPIVPDEKDLIGFITTGNYNLTEGKGFGIGSALLCKITDGNLGTHNSSGSVKKYSVLLRNICVVRDAGETFGRLAKWELI
jgi:ribonuclease P/MRP protein subunit POP1